MQYDSKGNEFFQCLDSDCARTLYTIVRTSKDQSTFPVVKSIRHFHVSMDSVIYDQMQKLK